MITNKDIEKLKTVFVTKPEFNEVKEDLAVVKQDVNVLKQDVKILKEDVSAIKEITQEVLSALDGITKTNQDLKSEYYALKASDDRQNKHIKQLADHNNLKLEE
jgi:hypothetical protein